MLACGAGGVARVRVITLRLNPVMHVEVAGHVAQVGNQAGEAAALRPGRRPSATSWMTVLSHKKRAEEKMKRGEGQSSLSTCRAGPRRKPRSGWKTVAVGREGSKRPVVVAARPPAACCSLEEGPRKETGSSGVEERGRTPDPLGILLGLREISSATAAKRRRRQAFARPLVGPPQTLCVGCPRLVDLSLLNLAHSSRPWSS